jgi:hypothetical protein
MVHVDYFLIHIRRILSHNLTATPESGYLILIVLCKTLVHGTSCPYASFSQRAGLGEQKCL